MGQITVTKTSDEPLSSLQTYTARFRVEIGDMEGTATTTADIIYGFDSETGQSMFNPKDISMEDGDLDIYEIVVAEITKQLLAEGFSITKQRFA
jgi:hypothetical protein